MFDFVRNHTRLALGFMLLLIIPSFVFFGVEGYSRFNDGTAAAVATDGDLARLTFIHNELERAAAANDINGYFEANQAFHQEMQLIVDNRWLSQAITDLRKVIKLSRHHSLFSDGRLKQSLAEHREILEALGRRDAAGTEQAMREHISSGRRALAKIAARKESAA